MICPCNLRSRHKTHDRILLQVRRPERQLTSPPPTIPPSVCFPTLRFFFPCGIHPSASASTGRLPPRIRRPDSFERAPAHPIDPQNRAPVQLALRLLRKFEPGQSPADPKYSLMADAFSAEVVSEADTCAATGTTPRLQRVNASVLSTFSERIRNETYIAGGFTGAGATQTAALRTFRAGLVTDGIVHVASTTPLPRQSGPVIPPVVPPPGASPR